METVFETLREETAAAARELRVPGVALGLLEGDREEVAGFGVTNAEHPLPVDADTLFQIGSITKTFVGTAAMRLVEQGRLDLDAPVRTYLPDFRLADEDTAARLTLRHVLTHTGGWQGDYFEDTGVGDDALARIVGRLDRLEQVTPLGAVFSYSNSGFYVAGRVLEVLTGQPFESVLEELVLAPLGLRMTFFRHRATEFVTHRVAAGHLVPLEGDAPPPVARPYARSRAGGPTGGLVSTVRDVLRYACFHLAEGTTADGTRVLSAEGVRLMQRPLVPAGWRGAKRGLSWSLLETDGVARASHEGATHGQRALLVLVPARHWALAVLTNADRGAELHGRVARRALQRAFGVRPPAEASPATIPLPRRREWAARYREPGGQGSVLLDVGESGDITFQAVPLTGSATSPPPRSPAPAARALPIAPDAFRVADGPEAGAEGELLRDDAGAVRWMRFAGRVLVREDPPDERSEGQSGRQAQE